MGSLFSSPAAGGDSSSKHLRPPVSVRIEKPANVPDASFYTTEAIYPRCIWRLVHRALRHYNENNSDAEFEYPAQPTTEMRCVWVGFREHFVWYHLGFSARRNQETHRFFAEMCYDIRSPKITVETCTILEEPLCRFRSRCAFCPENSEILHPDESEFVCGKEEQQTEFFRGRHMLVWPFDNPSGTVDLTWTDD